MILSLLFLLYLLSNTVLLSTEASTGERGKVREYIAQPSFLPAVEFPLWDLCISAKHALNWLSREDTKHIHLHWSIYLNRLALSCYLLSTYLCRTSKCHCPVIFFPLEC